MSTDSVLIYHVYTTVNKYIEKNIGTLKGMTNVPTNARYAYNNLKAESLKRQFYRISNEIESNFYTLSDFVFYLVYTRMISRVKSRGDIVSLRIDTLKKAKEMMSSEQLKDDIKFLRFAFSDSEYRSVFELFEQDTDLTKRTSTNVLCALVKNEQISPITYIYFYNRLTQEQKNNIFISDNLNSFHKEIEVISYFIKGVGYAN